MTLPSLDDGSRFADRLRVGVDIVQISRIAESLERFGDRFLRRLFTADELSYAHEAPSLVCERLAARFAAKEAALKALELADAGIDWRDIEVCKLPSGACRLRLHGKAAQQVAASGVQDVALSLSHDGDYATAFVTAIRHAAVPLSSSPLHSTP